MPESKHDKRHEKFGGNASTVVYRRATLSVIQRLSRVVSDAGYVGL